MGIVVKITHNDDGDKTDSKDWCATTPYGDSDRTLCTGEAYGYGESNAKYKEKEGPVTCCKCKKIIEYIIDSYTKK